MDAQPKERPTLITGADKMTKDVHSVRDEPEQPDLGCMSEIELVMLMAECGRSNDATDKDFVKACRDELARRKPHKARGTR